MLLLVDWWRWWIIDCIHTSIIGECPPSVLPLLQPRLPTPLPSFLHGLLGNKRNFAFLASSLCTQLRTPRMVYMVDLRNHGNNTH